MWYLVDHHSKLLCARPVPADTVSVVSRHNVQALHNVAGAVAMTPHISVFMSWCCCQLLGQSGTTFTALLKLLQVLLPAADASPAAGLPTAPAAPEQTYAVPQPPACIHHTGTPDSRKQLWSQVFRIELKMHRSPVADWPTTIAACHFPDHTTTTPQT